MSTALMENNCGGHGQRLGAAQTHYKVARPSFLLSGGIVVWTSPAASVDIPGSISGHPQQHRCTCPARYCPTAPAAAVDMPGQGLPGQVLPDIPADPGHRPQQRRWTCPTRACPARYCPTAPAAAVDMPDQGLPDSPSGGGGHARQRLWTSQQILADDPSSRLDDYNSCYRSSMLSPRLPSFSPHYIRILVL